MPAEFSRADIERIAALAHLELRDDEVELFARQLGEILEYANQLQQIDTTGVEPTSSVLIGDEGERADVPAVSLDRGLALASAPDAAPEVGLFRVPRVIG
ncbi:MAG: Asp-tRNA(Asn)/Glu-tRNA(Gln) amidotransferase subunit GatC [Vicinamibacterales bacterium]